ncbi:hypothetical protein [Rhizobium wuzhouense]|uniref:DUF1761 domain-containing protein n=1 Tax=Rhizobium wuzhouense TaxID=1986026 RepID=A0ABX5NXE0_9HYPH|nr:hypothetical protein [Rhizobium wuzhouense]PYB76984.1 hypothetical protein DMY87_00920 [Rhizobium wuzhouense]
MGKAFWLGFAAYLLPTFPLGYVWHLKTFAAAYHRLDMYRDDVLIPLGLGSMVIQGLIFSFAYPRLFSTAPADTWRSAAAAFLVFGLLAISFVVLPVAAKYRMASVRDFIALETAFTLLQFAIVCPLIALAHRQAG